MAPTFIDYLAILGILAVLAFAIRHAIFILRLRSSFKSLIPDMIKEHMDITDIKPSFKSISIKKRPNHAMNSNEDVKNAGISCQEFNAESSSKRKSDEPKKHNRVFADV